jgi:hypothetical protein
VVKPINSGVEEKEEKERERERKREREREREREENEVVVEEMHSVLFVALGIREDTWNQSLHFTYLSSISLKNQFMPLNVTTNVMAFRPFVSSVARLLRPWER